MSKPCPKCGFTAKSRSGRTLHMKKCCPDLLFKKTVVNMSITFSATADISDMKPVALFRKCWGAWQKGFKTQLQDVTINDVKVLDRKASVEEKMKMRHQKEKRALYKKARKIKDIWLEVAKEFVDKFKIRSSYHEDNYTWWIFEDHGRSCYFRGHTAHKITIHYFINRAEFAIENIASGHIDAIHLTDPEAFSKIRDIFDGIFGGRT